MSWAATVQEMSGIALARYYVAWRFDDEAWRHALIANKTDEELDYGEALLYEAAEHKEELVRAGRQRCEQRLADFFEVEQKAEQLQIGHCRFVAEFNPVIVLLAQRRGWVRRGRGLALGVASIERSQDRRCLFFLANRMPI